ncbi:hypothetical protein [Nostoc sp. C110]|uniref:hypothetical protein n=1 Tax=Nostoc sp. C110 TaxID=3349876 RepID=UPI00370DAD90
MPKILTILPPTEVTSSTIHTAYSEDFGFDFEFDEQVFRPAACIVGCSNYQRVE